MLRSPHWTRKMKPTTDKLARKVEVTETRSRFEILIVLWIYLINPACMKRSAPETQTSPRLEAQLSKNDTPDQRQTLYVNHTAHNNRVTLTAATISRLRFVDFSPSTFLISCSVERYSRVNMIRLSH